MKRLPAILILIGCQYAAQAQVEIRDSLRGALAMSKEDTASVDILYPLSDFYASTDFYNLDSNLFYASAGLALSRKNNFLRGEIDGLVISSFSQIDNGNTGLAKQLLFTALEIADMVAARQPELRLGVYRALGGFYAESIPDSSIYYLTRYLQLAQGLQVYGRQALTYLDIGYEFLLLGNYPQAMKLCIKGQQLAEQNNDLFSEAFLYRRRGDVYFFQGDSIQALRYYNLADSMAGTLSKMDGKRVQFLIDLSKARAYLKWNNLDAALINAQQFYKLSEKMHYSIGLSRSFDVLGNIYAKMGKEQVAYDYFKQGIDISLTQNIITSAVQAYNSLARYFFNSKQNDSCIYFANRAIDVIHKTGFLLNEPETYNILSDAYFAKKNLDSTFKYLHLAQATKDSLLGLDKIEQMQMSVFDEDQDKKQQAAAKLAFKNKLKVYVLLSGIAALVIITGLLWRNSKTRKKAYGLLLTQKAETDVQKDKADKALIELKATQSQLIQSEKMASLGELTAGIAHEIQNPLNFVNNFSEVNKELSDELKKDLAAGNSQAAIEIASDIQQNSEKINEHGKRAAAIVKSMLQHSRQSSGKKEPTDINALADEYLRLSYHGLRAKEHSFNATINTHFAQGIEKINIVSQDIGRVLLNLYNNAFYAVNERKKVADANYNPTVTVSTKSVNGKVEIRVADNGIGILPDLAEKIFQPFFTTKPAGQGTGLGLSLSYDIIKAHGGTIDLDTKQSEGSSFTILLPLQNGS